MPIVQAISAHTRTAEQLQMPEDEDMDLHSLSMYGDCCVRGYLAHNAVIKVAWHAAECLYVSRRHTWCRPRSSASVRHTIPVPPACALQVSEQMDSLRMLGSDPIDYLVTPRVLACMIAGPILNILCFAMGIGCSVLLAETMYSVSANIILDSVSNALTTYDISTSCIKALVFGTLISSVSCAWGFTTTGGAKGVGESTTSAVVISLVLIFIADFFLSFMFFQGSGDALRQCM